MSEAEKESTVYELARATYAAEERRYDDAETKIGRYLSVLFVVLGASVISADGLRAIPLTSWGNRLFVICVGLYFLCGMGALAFFLLSLRMHRFPALKLDRAVIDYFEQFTLPAALKGLAVAFFEAAADVRQQTQRKLDRAGRGYYFLMAAVVFAVLAR